MTPAETHTEKNEKHVSAGQNNTSNSTGDSLLHPAENRNILLWLAVLGIPGLLLFLILNKLA